MCQQAKNLVIEEYMFTTAVLKIQDERKARI